MPRQIKDGTPVFTAFCKGGRWLHHVRDNAVCLRTRRAAVVVWLNIGASIGDAVFEQAVEADKIANNWNSTGASRELSDGLYMFFFGATAFILIGGRGMLNGVFLFFI